MKLKGLVSFILIVSVIQVNAIHGDFFTDFLDIWGFPFDSEEDKNITAPDNSNIVITCKNCNVTVVDPDKKVPAAEVPITTPGSTPNPPSTVPPVTTTAAPVPTTTTPTVTTPPAATPGMMMSTSTAPPAPPAG